MEKISEEESTKYFDSRPLGSRIGAVISDQSQVIRDRKVLTDKEEEMWAKYGASEEGKGTMMKWVPKPQAWGGYRVVPRAVEFWQVGIFIPAVTANVPRLLAVVPSYHCCYYC